MDELDRAFWGKMLMIGAAIFAVATMAFWLGGRPLMDAATIGLWCGPGLMTGLFVLTATLRVLRRR